MYQITVNENNTSMRKNYIFKSLLLCLLLLPALTVSAQQVKSSTNKKAIKQYQKGMEHIRNKEFDEAIRYAKMAIQEDVSFTEAYLMVAESYSMKQESDLALMYYQKALYVDPDFSPQLYYFTAREYMRCNHYNEALEYFVQYFDHAGIDWRRGRTRSTPSIPPTACRMRMGPTP